MNLYGSTQATESQVITINVNKCVNKTECKDETEIENWLKGKALMIMYNQQSYNPTDYDGNPIQKTINWVFYSMKPKIHWFNLVPENIDTDENFFNIGWFSSKKMTLYGAQEIKNDFPPEYP